MARSIRQPTNKTRDRQQIEHFTKDSSDWWNPDGPFKPLHRLNPARLGFIRQQLVAHFGLDDKRIKALAGLSILDIGCGGGLVCEPLARLGANMTGIDADANGIQTAQIHAETGNLEITYICGAAEDLIGQKKYDCVLALEVIEHVSSPEEFVQCCAQLLKPDGLVIFSTLNRGWKSYALGIIAAEHILGWVPRGTHDWNRFLKPSELGRLCEKSGLKPIAVKGLVFNPLKNNFAMHDTDIDVNYFMVAENA